MSTPKEFVQPPLFKVLVEGRSCHGGALEWSLPTKGDDGAWAPGGWHEVAGVIQPCQNGLHLTAREHIGEWIAPRCAVYLAETEGEVVSDTNKVAARKVRLLRPAEYAECGVLVADSGAHVITSGHMVSSGSASVEAYGSASVEAYDSASVKASGSASVKAYGSASVKAYGSASVEAYGSASVKAYGSASVEAYDSASVKASDSSTVCSGPWHQQAAHVEVKNRAVHVDRRKDKTVIRHAEDGLTVERAEEAKS